MSRQAIPDIGDYTIKHKKRMQSFVPVPDTLLSKAVAEKATVTALDEHALANGLATPSGITRWESHPSVMSISS